MRERSDQSVAYSSNLYNQRQLTQKVDDLYKQIEALKNQLAQSKAEHQTISQKILATLNQRDSKISQWGKRQSAQLMGEMASLKESVREQVGTLDFRLDEIEALAARANRIPQAVARMRNNLSDFFRDLDAIADPSLPDDPDQWQSLPEPDGDDTAEFIDFPEQH
jgi:chromosome segregation ATPase